MTLYKRVESGKWNVSVYPICEKFPCKRSEFKGSWEDRFPYDYVKDMYEEAKALGDLAGFYQELMLQIKSDEDRLVKDDEIIEYAIDKKYNPNYHYYITTDFATSEKTSSDFSVITVWAMTPQGNAIIVDGQAVRQTMDKNIEALFRYVSIYKPLQVGIEVTGQQGAFTSWIAKEMVERNIYFNVVEVRPNKQKLVRFNAILPMFKNKKIMYNTHLPDSYKQELVNELKNVVVHGFKSTHDDICDTISMLYHLDITYPTTSEIESFPKVEYGNITFKKYQEDKMSSLFDEVDDGY